MSQLFRLVNEQVRRNAAAAVQAVAISGEKVLVVRIEEEESKRTQQQNKYLWGVVYQTIVDNDPGFFRSDIIDGIRKQARLSVKDVVHEFCKAQFLRAAEFADLNLVVSPSTAKLPRREFHEYVENIRRWAAETLQVFIPDPTVCGYEDLAWRDNERH
ncbi:MAG: recombination protein NinB [Cardiobacteriaceae bacterium]|nr:recombination protein NinB [Cardiobacteriaceae bacterium]